MKVSDSFTSSDCLVLAEDLFDKGRVEAAELWRNIAKEKQKENELTSFDTNLLDLKMRIKEVRDGEEEEKQFKNLCAKTKTTENVNMLKNGSVYCRYVSDANNPLIKWKMEEFSQEPIVQLIHDFLVPGEVDHFLKESLNFDFSIAPTTGGDDEDEYAYGRHADSYFINEKEDAIGSFITKLKARLFDHVIPKN